MEKCSDELQMNTMMRHWSKFPGRPNSRLTSDGVRVTIGPKGVIRMNKHAWAAIGRPEAAELWFDRINQIIGIVPREPEIEDAFPLKDINKGTGKIIRASPFCTHNLIKMMRTGVFNKVEINTQRIMSLYLDSLSAVGRGSK